LGWDVHDTGVVARACLVLFSELLPITTGEILHVDGASMPWAANSYPLRTINPSPTSSVLTCDAINTRTTVT
jgi:hypothetical protein